MNIFLKNPISFEEISPKFLNESQTEMFIFYYNQYSFTRMHLWTKNKYVLMDI